MVKKILNIKVIILTLSICVHAWVFVCATVLACIHAFFHSRNYYEKYKILHKTYLYSNLGERNVLCNRISSLSYR